MSNQNLEAIRILGEMYSSLSHIEKDILPYSTKNVASYIHGHLSSRLINSTHGNGTQILEVLSLITMARDIERIPHADIPPYAPLFVKQLETVVQSFQRGTQSE